LAGLLIFSFKFVVLFYTICCLCPEIHFTLVECKGNATAGAACLLSTPQSAILAVAEAEKVCLVAERCLVMLGKFIDYPLISHRVD